MATAVLGSRQLADVLLETTDDVVIVVAPDYTVVLANRAAARASTAATPSDLVGRKCHRMLHDSSHPCSGCPVAEAFGSIGCSSGQVHRAGRQMRVTAAPIPCESGGADFALVRERETGAGVDGELETAWEQLRLVSEVVDDIVVTVDRDLRIASVNTAVERVTGYSAQDYLSGRAGAHMIHPDDLPRVKEEVDRISAHGTPGAVEFRFLCKDGTCKWAEARGYPVPKPSGQVEVVAVIRDITQRKLAEEALAQSEKRFRTLVEATPVGLWMLDENRNTIYLEPGHVLPRLGYTPEEVTTIPPGQRPWEPPETERAMLEATERVYNGGVVSNLEVPVIARDGSTMWLSRTMAPVFDDDGRVVGCVGVSFDITERKLAEQALAESESLLSSIIDQSPFSTWIADAEGTNIRINEACKKLFGIDSDDQVVGKYNLYRDEVLAEQGLLPLLDKVFKEGETITVEIDYDFSKVRHVHVPRATHKRLETTVFPVKDGDGRVVNAVVQHRDVTQERELEAELRHAQKMEAIGTLAGGIAHDFNNLLGAMMGYTSLLMMRLRPEDELYRYVEPIHRAGTRAAELTSQLLSFARRGERQMRPVDLNASVREVVTLLERSAPKNVEIITSLADDLPATLGDAGQLQQVLMNVCVNALDAMPHGGRLSISTRAVRHEGAGAPGPPEPSGDFVLVYITDTGVGMDEQTRMRACDPFFTTKQPGEGTGLGLSMVYGIVKDHGGHLEISSAPGQGTQVALWFRAHGGEAEPEGIAAGDLRTGSETVLVIEDETLMRNLLGRMLREMGYTVLLAADGHEGIAIYEEKGTEIDLVVLDMVMPRLGGAETFRRLRRLDPDVKVMACSGYACDGAAEAILQEGACAFLRKPFTVEEVSAALRAALDG